MQQKTANDPYSRDYTQKTDAAEDGHSRDQNDHDR
jgi:hypothetical protein